MVSLSLENFGNFWKFLEPKENHYSSPSSRIKGYKTRKLLSGKLEKGFERGVDLCGARGVDSCTGARKQCWSCQR